MPMADAKKEAENFRKLLKSALGSLTSSLKTSLMTAGMDLSPPAGGGTVRTGAGYWEGSHAESILQDWMANKYAGSVTAGATVLYLYVYYSPCEACKNKLLRAKNNYPNFAAFHLAFREYFITGPGGTGYRDLGEAQQAMQELANNGWNVSVQ